MSSVILGESDYPIHFQNVAAATLPAYCIFRLSSGTRDATTNELYPRGTKVSLPADETLFVNSGLATPDNGFGWCRSTLDAPFWVVYDPSNAPSIGDNVGPVDTQTYVSVKGSGFVVIYKDTSKGLVYCAPKGAQLWYDAELGGDLAAATNSKSGAATVSGHLLVPDPATPSTFVDGPTITITNRSVDMTGHSGDYCVLIRIGAEWRPIWMDC